jgi:hypothetical protein
MNRDRCGSIRVAKYILSELCIDLGHPPRSLDNGWWHTMLELIINHMVWKCVSLGLSSTFTSVFCLFDLIGYFDHKISIREMGIISPYFGHRFIGGLFHLLLMAVLHILVKRTTAACRLAKVIVVGDVLRADVARRRVSGRTYQSIKHSLPLHIPTVRARHLVASVFFDEGMLAIIALPDQRSGHSLFDDMAKSNLTFFVGFFASQRDVGLLIAQSAACFAAFSVLATELCTAASAKFEVVMQHRLTLIDLYRWTLHLEVAEGAVRQEVESSGSKILHLLHMFEALKSFLTEYLL